MRILGDLVAAGGIPAVAWATRCIVRDVLAYKLARQVLKGAPEDQRFLVVRSVYAMWRSGRK